MQQQLGLPNAPILVRRVWCTPGGRLAAHVALPTPLAAQVLARKRHRLRGTAYSVDLLRDQLALELWKVGREQLQRQQGVALDRPVAGPQQGEAPEPAAPGVVHGWQRLMPFLLIPCFVFVFCLLLSLIMHFFPP
jgi:hypothetical protein